MKDNRKYLDPSVVAQLGNIELKAKLVVEGFITGLHRSPYHGFSVEFAEHRQYRQGDEIRHIDWQVFARTNKYFVKQFEEETNLRSIVALDSSASMGFVSKGQISKYEYGSYLAAAIIYMMMNQRDAAGLALYDTEIRKFMPSRSKMSYIAEIIKTLEAKIPENQTGTAKALDRVAERLKRRGLVIVISDFFDDPASVISSLKRFRHQGHEVIAFQILDPRELDFNFGATATFKDMETDEKMITQPHLIKKAYSSAMQNFIEEIRKGCFSARIDHHLISTNQTFDVALKEYLKKRQGLA